MTIRVEIIGGDDLNKNFRKLPDAALRHVREAVAVSAKQVESEIQKSMRAPKTGRIYRRGSGFHQASAAGEAPAIDTGVLRSSIAVKIEPGGLSATIGVHDLTKVKYALRLEFGFVGRDSLGRAYKMAPRPFVFPAFEKNREFIRDRIEEAMRRAQDEVSK